ncbi:cytochrome P450 family protein [Nocardiopsis ganjiahuensis]|uniref:cytochrome P450 n=1 Tax=Nocardiopsis ganjiahuensis TaxID=239984 RepID=UPI00034D5D48|nr:cytochrome P450 [Nocardiopsis ganjiahuensis]
MAPRCPHAELHSAEFHADPHAVNQRMVEEHGPVFPAEIFPGIKAWVVADYSLITAWCRDPRTFRRDSRLWLDWREGRIPDDAPVVAMMMHRPNLLYADGDEHARLKRVVVDSLGRVPESRIGDITRRHADILIDAFCQRGHAELVSEYARLLPLLVLCDVFGFSRDVGERVLNSLGDLWDGIDVIKANGEYERALSDAISAKHASPGDDITSWMLEHRAGLSDEELLAQLVVTIGAGAEPTANLVSGTVHTLLADDDVRQAFRGARVGIGEAIDQVLWRDPPVNNYPVLYPVKDVRVSTGTVIRAGEPILLGYAAAHAAMSGGGPDIEQGNRAHLAFGVGPHRCPAQGFAYAIAQVGVDALTKRLPDLRTAEGAAQRRPAPFALALAALPVTFTPDPPKGTTPPWQQTSPSSTPTTSTGRQPSSEAEAPSSKLRSLVAWLFGR